ncbi:uncharacterized protein LOC125541535 [Triticum urartu]|uniref:uncharacterized protein LOC125541535 n=1 Tax=Triticum urartu TaxID=4572 RepID=UPI002043519D|nr:uncharacterized protein LOC125541535 [Triticum urartu]
MPATAPVGAVATIHRRTTPFKTLAPPLTLTRPSLTLPPTPSRPIFLSASPERCHCPGHLADVLSVNTATWEGVHELRSSPLHRLRPPVQAGRPHIAGSELSSPSAAVRLPPSIPSPCAPKPLNEPFLSSTTPRRMLPL